MIAHIIARTKTAPVLISHGVHTSTRTHVRNVKHYRCVRVHTHMCANMCAPRAVRAVCGLQVCGAVCGRAHARADS